MDNAAFAQLQNAPPRQIRRRRKSGDYDAWSIVRVSAALLATSVVCMIAGWLSYPDGTVLLFFGGLLSLLSVPDFLARIIGVSKQKKLVKYGHAAIGEVLTNEGKSIPNDFGSYHIVSYKFVTQEGAEIQGCWKYVDQPFWHCKSGDKFIVIYSPQRPASHIAYESALFENK